jgi:anti-anti-sigma factor
MATDQLFQVSADQSIQMMRFRLPAIMDTMEIDTLIEDVLKAVDVAADGRWVLDMTEVAYMGSSVLGMMVNLRERIRRGGGHLVICGLSPTLLKIFQTCCLERLFSIHKTQPEAVEFILNR